VCADLATLRQCFSPKLRTFSRCSLNFRYVFSRSAYAWSDISYFCTFEVSSSQPLADSDSGSVSMMCSTYLHWNARP
jgi:hypothetical protein